MGKKKAPIPLPAAEAGALWSTMKRALFGRYNGTSGELVCDWVRLDTERRGLLERLCELAKSPLLPGTSKTKAWLETWFEGAESADGSLDWGFERFDFFDPAVKPQMEFRGAVARLHEKAKSHGANLLNQTRKALTEFDFEFFKNLRDMMQKLMDDTLARIKPSARAASPAHVIALIVASERVELLERAAAESGAPEAEPGAREDAEDKIVLGWMSQELPFQGARTISELREEYVRRTGGTPQNATNLERSLRRWCQEIGYIPRELRKGRPVLRKRA